MSVFGLSEKDVLRLKRLLDAFETGKLTPRVQAPAVQKKSPVETYLGRITEEVSPILEDVPGVGVARIYTIDRANDNLLVPTQTERDVFNATDQPILVDTYVTLSRDPMSGSFWIISGQPGVDGEDGEVGPCPSLSFSGTVAIEEDAEPTVEITAEDGEEDCSKEVSFSFLLPPGQQGIPGVPGPQGSVGPPGAGLTPGCGLQTILGVTSVAPIDIRGRGLATGLGCQLEAALGSGLLFDNLDRIKVDATPTPAGFNFSALTSVSLSIDEDCQLTLSKVMTTYRVYSTEAGLLVDLDQTGSTESTQVISLCECECPPVSGDFAGILTGLLISEMAGVVTDPLLGTFPGILAGLLISEMPGVVNLPVTGSVDGILAGSLISSLPGSVALPVSGTLPATLEGSLVSVFTSVLSLPISGTLGTTLAGSLISSMPGVLMVPIDGTFTSTLGGSLISSLPGVLMVPIDGTFTSTLAGSLVSSLPGTVSEQ